MPHEENEVLYTYGWFEKIWVYIMVLFLAMTTLLAIASLVMVLPALLNEDAPSASIGPIDIALILLLPAIPGFLTLLFSNMYPSLRISDSGIYVQVFLFWWAFVPWSDVKEVRKAWWFSRSRLVIVRQLTPIHRFISCTCNFKPAFLIKHTLIGFDKAVKTIEKNMGDSS